MMQLKVLKGPQKQGEEFELKTGESLVLGRSTACDVQLLAFGVSKQHCKLTALPGGKLEVEDLGSSNGTFVNGVQIQKQVLRSGDSISFSQFLFQILWKPDIMPSAPAIPSFSNSSPAGVPSSSNHQDTLDANFSEKTKSSSSSAGLQAHFASWIDPLAEQFSVHMIILTVFVLWTLGTIFLSVVPFANQANLRIQESSVEIAKLYARQLARINQKAVVESRISDVINQLDETPGATQGVLKTYIFDAQRGRVMAPVSEAGNSLPNAYAVKSLQQKTEWWVYDPIDKVAYVSAPIFVGTPEGNVVAATAFVIFDPTHEVFSFARVLNSALTSLVVLFAFVIVAIFIYQRVIIAPVRKIAQNLERAIMNSRAPEKIKTQWYELRDIADKVEVLISRMPTSGNAADRAPKEWSIAFVREIPAASAAFDIDLKILEWNPLMEQVTGVRRDYAVGAEIGVASRDTAFEASVRDVAARALANPWVAQSKPLDFQGRQCTLSMIFGGENYLLLIRKEGEE